MIMSRSRSMASKMSLFIVLCLFITSGVLVNEETVHAATVNSHTAPSGANLSTDFTVSVSGSNVPVYRAYVSDDGGMGGDSGDHGTDYSFAYFDFSETVTVTITASGGRSAGNTVVLPTSAGITPVRSGSTVTFTMNKPANISVELNGKDRPLLLFANPLEVNPPTSSGNGVIYFGPGLHTPAMIGNNGVINLTSNQTLYLAPGAIVQAAVVAEGSNITIKGRGILDQSPWEHWTTGQNNGPSWVVVEAKNCSNFNMEGIIIHGAWSWTTKTTNCNGVTVDNLKIAGSKWANDDGFDPVNSTNILIKNSFFRTDDDNIAVKGENTLYGDSGYMIVQDCVFWSDRARIFLIGDESATPRFTDIIYRNIDIIHFWMDPILIRPGSEAIAQNITFENIRIHGSGQPGIPLIELTPSINQYMNPQTPGFINNVKFKNIHLTGSYNPSYGLGNIVVKGYDSTHTVTNVTFENVYRYGSLLTSGSPNLTVGPNVSNINFTSPASTNQSKKHWQASSDFGAVQGTNGWHYQQLSGSAYSNMTWNAGNGYWTGAQPFSNARPSVMHPDTNDAVRKWVAPYAMPIHISGNVHKDDIGGGDGVIVTIKKNGTTLWGPAAIAYNDAAGQNYSIHTSVNQGDEIYFIVNRNTANNYNDATYFNPSIVDTTVNYVANPGFESGATNWYEWHDTAVNPNAVVYTDSYEPNTGNNFRSHWASSAYKQTTGQMITGLTNGTYTLKAWVKSSGGFNVLSLKARNYGGSELTANLSLSAFGWTEYTISNIQVTNGQCEVLLWSESPGGTNWVGLDDVKLTKS